MTMFRAHELIAAMKPESGEYKDCLVSIKFDLGDIENVENMLSISKPFFFKIPAPICLFQVTVEMDLHFFLAKQCSGGTVWKAFNKQLNDGFRFFQEDFELFIPDDGYSIIAKKISTDEVLITDKDFEGEFQQGDLSDTNLWVLQKFFQIAIAIEVFSCSNVIAVNNDPPKFINAKRIQKGKQPFFSYKTLHIKDGNVSNKNRGEGTHASPRLHLRRGHIRRYASGERVWVRATLVGDKSKGFVLHDYKVTSYLQSKSAGKPVAQ